ncbi:hypothetical protein PC117_g14368 [Phytophthora cactorum]|uniref:Uncharacterized protein n=1 Tax=Phytophthora cactorum TaxID=29920 RepID=A0A8T1CW21_9STRA|nr:hypothetical protein PC117_g14368 [Phytophthora cactorum]
MAGLLVAYACLTTDRRVQQEQEPEVIDLTAK